MAQTYGAKSYVQTQVTSADPMQLVVLLYDGALRQATIAHDAMVRKDIPTRKTAIGKALAITWSVDLIYDDDVRLFGNNNNAAGLQLKSLIGIGFLLKF